MLFEEHILPKRRDHMVILQVCVVMSVCGQEGMMLRICYGAHAAVIQYIAFVQVPLAAQVKGYV